MLPTTVVTWKWPAPKGYRSSFTAESVNVLRRMVARHFPHPHRFVCVTHETDGLDREVEVIPPWDDFVSLVNPSGARNPSCYRRLRAFHPDIAAAFGPRFVSLDLDCIIVNDLTPVWDRPEDFIIWGDTNPRTAYNGSMFMMTAGARPKVWTKFDPNTSPRLAHRAGCFGSDQGWISFCLGPRESKWKAADGVYSYRNELMNRPDAGLPANARIVFFHGEGDPWTPRIQARHSWVRSSYA